MAVIGRLAPSPTGHLHLGNAWAFALAWLAARSQDGKVLLRMEDIDPVRSSAEYARDIKEDLQWLGITWDGDEYYQSRRTDKYTEALGILEKTGRVYPCFCTRKELRSMAGAPHIDDRGAPYPGTCRHLTEAQRTALIAAGRRPTLRFDTENLPKCEFTDGLYGRQIFSADDCGGDFPLRRSDGVWAYQLAVSVDDADMGVTQVVRGRDILVSTPRQIMILNALHAKIPQYAHIPLLCDAEGQRLAKRHEKTLSIRILRDAGVSAEEIIGHLAYWAHLRDDDDPCTLPSLAEGFSLSALPKEDIRCDAFFGAV